MIRKEYTIANIAGGVAGTASESTATNATIASSEGKLTVTVTDPSDTFEMPTTGGIGTTIFYVVGAVLVLGAAVILITRRRMRNRV